MVVTFPRHSFQWRGQGYSGEGFVNSIPPDLVAPRSDWWHGWIFGQLVALIW